MSRYPVDGDAKRGGSALSVIEVGRMRVIMEKNYRGGDPVVVKP